MNVVSYDEVVQRLLSGQVGVMPTDTVYGLVARASDHMAVARLYALKDRNAKPGTLIASSTDQLHELGISKAEVDKVSHLWPNPLSAVLAIIGNGYLHQNVGTLAVRVVSDQNIRRLLDQTGALITTSANQPGEAPATTITEAIAYFGNTIDFYLDGGTINVTLPSTIVKPTDDGLVILRQGSITP